MLRRLSVHAAGLSEAPGVYVCTDINAETLEDSLDASFTRNTSVLRHYAIAGVLHLQHLADMARPDAIRLIERHATLVAPALNISREEVEVKLKALLLKHATEWTTYLESLDKKSFVKQWT